MKANLKIKAYILSIVAAATYGCSSGDNQGNSEASSDSRVPSLSAQATTDTTASATITAKSKLTVFVGHMGSIGYNDAVGSAAHFNFPGGVAVDSAGNVYLSEEGNDTIRKITPAGEVTTLAGSAGQVGYADGTGSEARFNLPAGMAVDAAANLYVVDTFNNVIRKVTQAGVVTTFAGSAGVYGHVDGTGTAAVFQNLFNLAIDAAGNVYATDGGTIRVMSPSGVVSTLPANAPISPCAVAVDGSQTVYEADCGDNRIKKIAPDGTVTVIAGSGASGNTDGSASAASFYATCGIAVDGVGNVFVTDSNDDVRKITPDGTVTTIAGLANGYGSADGNASKSRFYNLNQIVIDPQGDLYLTDSLNNAIRILTPSTKGKNANAHTVYTSSTLAGNAAITGTADGDKATATFAQPAGLAADAQGNLWVLDAAQGNTVRKVSSAAVTTTAAGTGGVIGSADGTGPAASFNLANFGPAGLAFGTNGVLAVADTYNHTIRYVTAAGVVTTFVGSPGDAGSADGMGAAAQFNTPTGLAYDTQGNLYVADQQNGTIRMVTPAGVVTTLAGTAGSLGSSDGIGAAAQFNQPSGIVMGHDGALYVSDTGNRTIRRVTLQGVVTTVAGIAGITGTDDGPALSATFAYPGALSVSPTGFIYIVDANYAGVNLIRALSPSGVVSTVIGSDNIPAQFIKGDLPGSTAAPRSVAIVGSSLYIATENGIAVASNIVQ